MGSMKKLIAEFKTKRSTSGSVARAFRKKLDLTLKEVEEITGIKESNLSALENDRLEMSKRMAEILGAAYGVHAYVFLFPSSKMAKDKRLTQIERRAATVLKRHG